MLKMSQWAAKDQMSLPMLSLAITFAAVEMYDAGSGHPFLTRIYFLFP